MAVWCYDGPDPRRKGVVVVEKDDIVRTGMSERMQEHYMVQQERCVQALKKMKGFWSPVPPN